MSELENTSLMNEIKLIIAANNAADEMVYDAFIHVVDNNVTYKALNVMSIDIDRRYGENYSDIMFVELAIPPGTYADNIYPFKNNLEITLLETPVNDIKQSPVAIRFKAILKDEGKPRLNAGKQSGQTTEMLDISSVFPISFQLLSMVNYKLRTLDVGCIIRKSTVKDTLLTIITDQVNKIKINGKNTTIGVDLIDPDNTEVKEQIVIPHGTKLINLPEYIQTNCCGVYNSGIASYIQGNTWYIYPKYNFKREVLGNRLVDFIIVPKDKFPGINTTYRHKGEQLVILITGDAKAFDNTKYQEINQATGIRFTNSETIFNEDTIKRENNKVIVDRSSMNTELISSESKDDNDMVPFSNSSITSNPFNEYSKLSSLQSRIIAFVWENSNPQLIKPGMMCNIYAIDNDGKVIIGNGVIKSTQHHTRLAHKGIVEKKTITNTAIEVNYENGDFSA